MDPNLRELIGEAFEKTADLLEAYEQEYASLSQAASQTKRAADAEEITQVATIISAHNGVPIDDDLKTKVAGMAPEFRQLLRNFSEKSASTDFGSSSERPGSGTTQSDDPTGYEAFGNWIMSGSD